MYTMPYGPEKLRDLYTHTSSGHFFDRDTMRFFASRLTSLFVRVSDTTAYFVTSEKKGFDDRTRVFTIRRANLVTETRESDGRQVQKIRIETVGDFARMTRARAATAMRNIAKTGA